MAGSDVMIVFYEEKMKTKEDKNIVKLCFLNCPFHHMQKLGQLDKDVSHIDEIITMLNKKHWAYVKDNHHIHFWSIVIPLGPRSAYTKEKLIFF